MKNLISLTAEQQRAYLIWVFAPAAAHIISGSIITLLLFPILVTISQYFLFRQYPFVNRTFLWFIVLPAAFMVWIKAGPVMNEHKPNGISHGVIAYYISQLCGSLIIPFMTQYERADRVIGWIVSNLTAMIIWLTLYSLLKDSMPSNFDFAYFIAYPAISLIAHGLSGFFLFGKYTVD
jgi:hypothetical protein